MTVKDVMHQGTSWVEADTKLDAIAKIMRDEDIGSAPVCKDDRLIGMVTDRDITCRVLADNKDAKKLRAQEDFSAATSLIENEPTEAGLLLVDEHLPKGTIFVAAQSARR